MKKVKNYSVRTMLIVITIMALAVSFITFQFTQTKTMIEAPKCPQSENVGICSPWEEITYDVRGFPVSYYKQEVYRGEYSGTPKANYVRFVLNSFVWAIIFFVLINLYYRKKR